MKASGLPSDFVKGSIALILAVIVAVKINSASGPLPALVGFVSTFLLGFNLSSRDRIWRTVSSLARPARALLIWFAAGTIYFGLKGVTLKQILLSSVGSSLVGAAFAFVFLGYWTIAE
ncbi:MAG: hypothetical protein ABEJ36_03510 [Candidatus Nanosalina sp.]